MIKHYFITGTDTEVGKTIASTVLLQTANLQGFATAGYKPVACGSKKTAEGLRNSDVLALQYNSNVDLTYEEVNLYTFLEPTAPHIVSIDENRPISFKALSVGLRALEKKANWILVEGAGGWFTPLTEKLTFADWVTIEQLPVILIVSVKLGCINHALLTSLAIKQANLRLVGWIANNVVPPGKRHSEYLKTLKMMLPMPFLFEISWFDNPDMKKFPNKYLNLKHLNFTQSIK